MEKHGFLQPAFPIYCQQMWSNTNIYPLAVLRQDCDDLGNNTGTKQTRRKETDQEGEAQDKCSLTETP